MTTRITSKLLFAAIVFLACFNAFSAKLFDLKVCDSKAAFYFADQDIMLGNSSLQYAVIYIHGIQGGAGDSAANMRRKFQEYSPDCQVLTIAPLFPTEKTCPKSRRKKALLWEKGWRCGDEAVNGNNISSYEVIDRIYSILSDSKLYPSMKKITLCGFSAGGQFVNRYTAVGKLPVNPKIETVFAVANPSVYLYVNKLRFADGKFIEIKANNGFNNWHYGLDNRNKYGKDLLPEQIMKNLVSRKTVYFCGTADLKGMNNREAMLQGKNRYDRFLIYQKYTNLFPEWSKAIRFIAVPEIQHSSTVFYYNNELQELVFGKKLEKE